MPFRLHIVEGVTNNPFLVDDERRTYDTELLVAVPFAKLGHAEFATDFTFLVGKQSHREAVLVAKISVRQAVIPRNAEDHAIVFGELVFVVGEVCGFEGAVGRAVARIEKQHGVLTPPQRGKVEPLHVGVGQ